MKLLEHSDWKKRIAFDNIIYKTVKRFSLRLNNHERELMDIQIDFYRKHFSLLQVMNHFQTLKTTEEKEIFIKAVVKRIDCILYIPRMLQTYFRKKIDSEFSEYKDFFKLLLKYGLEQKDSNPMLKIYKAILGQYYNKVVNRVKSISKKSEIPVQKKTLKPEAVENTARALIHDLQDDLILATIYGRSSIRKSVPISIVDDYGYGEWISKNVTYNTNRLFIYSNHNTLTDVQLKHMIYFNVYPGYGHFYNTVVDKSKSMAFDNGATYLINGWAMYAMCRNTNSAYAQNMMIEGCLIARNLLKKHLEKSYENINVYLLGKYTKAKAQQYLLDYTQYPGHYMSYILGELAIEFSMQKGFGHSPVDYLHSLSQVNCGDFFALYSPRMQKKIAKTNVTAKIPKKFLNK